jgi:hypothetical protein
MFIEKASDIIQTITSSIFVVFLLLFVRIGFLPQELTQHRTFGIDRGRMRFGRLATRRRLGAVLAFAIGIGRAIFSCIS